MKSKNLRLASLIELIVHVLEYCIGLTGGGAEFVGDHGLGNFYRHMIPVLINSQFLKLGCKELIGAHKYHLDSLMVGQTILSSQ